MTCFENNQKLIQQKFDKSNELLFLNLPKDDPVVRKPSIKKARQYLNWAPKISLSEGLEYTIKYYKYLIINQKNNL